MHSGIILLVVFSILLIALMVTCFICFIRSRRKEDEEFMQQVQIQAARQQDYQNRQMAALALQQQHQQFSPKQQQLVQSPSDQLSEQQLMITPTSEQLQLVSGAACNLNGASTHSSLASGQQLTDQPHQHQHHERSIPHSQQHQPRTGATYAGFSPGAPQPQPLVSPYHAAAAAAAQQRGIAGDMSQQINSAIIGSSEAEFQNDFIQVFPMYQIAPQPEKNTTPYLT